MIGIAIQIIAINSFCISGPAKDVQELTKIGDELLLLCDPLCSEFLILRGEGGVTDDIDSLGDVISRLVQLLVVGIEGAKDVECLRTLLIDQPRIFHPLDRALYITSLVCTDRGIVGIDPGLLSLGIDLLFIRRIECNRTGEGRIGLDVLSELGMSLARQPPSEWALRIRFDRLLRRGQSLLQQGTLLLQRLAE